MVRKANAEATFEKRPRKHAEVAQHRELLPTKEADGSLKRQRVKLTKKEIAKQRKAESGNDKGKKKKSEKKAEKLAAAAGGKKTSEAALHKMAAQVETSAMTLDEKKVAVARLSQRLLEAPHKNVKLLRQLHDLATRDPSAVVQRLALLSEVAVLRDVMPAYRIRLPSEKELQMQVSSDVAELRDYEKVLLRSYEDCLASLGKWLRGSPAQRVAAVRGLCALVTKGRDFNAIHKIVEMLVPVCNWKEDALREAACGAMAELFVEDGQGETTLLAVRCPGPHPDPNPNPEQATLLGVRPTAGGSCTASRRVTPPYTASRRLAPPRTRCTRAVRGMASPFKSRYATEALLAYLLATAGARHGGAVQEQLVQRAPRDARGVARAQARCRAQLRGRSARPSQSVTSTPLAGSRGPTHSHSTLHRRRRQLEHAEQQERQEAQAQPRPRHTRAGRRSGRARQQGAGARPPPRAHLYPLAPLTPHTPPYTP